MPDDQTTSDLEQRLLAFVNQASYQPVKPKVIAKKLGLSKEEAKELRKIARRLVKRGQLSWGVSHQVKKAAGDAAADRVTGVFRRTQDGYGYVTPAGAVPGGDRNHDIYVPASDARDASTGDVVLVKVTRRHGYRGRREGIVQEVIERETHRFVGTYFEMGGQGFVTVDGTLFSQPIGVGDPGAKNAREDDKVVFEMVRFPSHTHDGEGVIVEVLGPRGDPGVDTLCIIREFDLPVEFHEEALADARREAEKFDESIPAWRKDLTAETVITIDPVDARDFDDAISLARLENGHWRLGVHIADVAHFVRPGTMLDREAYSRATSVYLPDRVIPMLPEVISNSLASLQPERTRYTKTVFIEFTADGAPVATDLHASAIRSKRRFTYEEVDDYLADRQRWETKLTPEVHALLGRMHELAMILRRRRVTRGALEINMPEVKVELDGDGRVRGAVTVEHTESHQVIEEFMLAANEAVARRLAEEEWEFLRRVHEAPSPLKIQALTQFIKELGFKVDNLQDRFAVQRLLNDVLGQPEQRAVHYAVLRSMPKAIYSPAEEGHFALASECYCHFTSPIRRYPDLTVHRLVDALLAGKSGYHEFGQLATWAEHCSDRERRAEAAERELTKLKLLAYLNDRIGEEMDAVITGVESYGLFAQGLELPAEGLIHITSLEDDFYGYDRGAHTLTGRRAGNIYRLGDLIRVTVYRVDLERRELDFRLVRKLKRDGEAPARKAHRKKRLNRKTSASGPKGKGKRRR
jgi:ribonuclease R